MRLAGRVAAAIEVLHEITTRHRPASEALKDWGKSHRFAGSADRHAIGTLVYDALRMKLSAGRRGGGQSARAIILGVLAESWGLHVEDIAALAEDRHGISKLTDDERTALAAVPHMAPYQQANVPDWLWPAFEAQFGADATTEGKALSRRAPIDLRVNTLKTTRDKLVQALLPFGAMHGPWSPLAVRIAAPGPDQKHVNVEAEPAHGLGWFEVQDVASQLAALLTGAQPGERVADICAGAGGKTLALAAMMVGEGELVAYDHNRHRLRPIFERLTRAGARNVTVEKPDGLFDCVVIDAPCSGSGSWRRRPDTKWKLTRRLLDERRADQRDLLQQGAGLVRPGGRLVYITCSVLPEENTAQVAAFLAQERDFMPVPFAEQWRKHVGGDVPVSADHGSQSLLLTPARHDTDGFFVSVMARRRSRGFQVETMAAGG